VFLNEKKFKKHFYRQKKKTPQQLGSGIFCSSLEVPTTSGRSCFYPCYTDFLIATKQFRQGE
jgi:hypothetical protein